MTATVRTNTTHANRATDAVMSSLRGMQPSTLPALVFTRLTAVSLPAFSNRCRILVRQDGLAADRFELALTDAPNLIAREDNPHWVRNFRSARWIGDHVVQTAFNHNCTSGPIGYRAGVLHLFNIDHRPTKTDVALAPLAVEQAVTIFRRKQDPDLDRSLSTDGAQQSAGDTSRHLQPERVVDYTCETNRPIPAMPLMAWAYRKQDRHEQFKHAVLDGSHLSACGAMMTIIGGPWPEPPAPTPQPRCEICSQAVNRTWAGLDYIMSTAEEPR